MHPLSMNLLRAIAGLTFDESQTLLEAAATHPGPRWWSLGGALGEWLGESPDDHDEHAVVGCEGCGRCLPLEWTVSDGEGVRLCPSCAPAIADGVDLIAAERRRQVEVEGWTPENDDLHPPGVLALAGALYATPPRTRREKPRGGGGTVPVDWPWSAKRWKPCPDDRVRELAKAGALIAAEIDRIRRAREEHVAAADAAGSRSPSDYEFTGHEPSTVVPGPPSPPDRWVVLHVPGRQTYAGRLTDLGHGLFRLDIPDVEVPAWRQIPAHTIPAWSFTFGPSAVFQLVDVSEAYALTRAADLRHGHPEWKRPEPASDQHGHRWQADDDRESFAWCTNPGCEARLADGGSGLPCPAVKAPGDGTGVMPDETVDGKCRDCSRPVGGWHAPNCPRDEIPF